MNKTKQFTFFMYRLSLFMALLLLSACNEEMRESLRPVPMAFGRVNGIAIIADKALWEGPVGDSLRSYYSSAYLILPQPEPLFDLSHYTIEQLNEETTRRELRNYLIVANLDDSSSPTTQMVLQDIGSEKARRAKEDPSYSTVIGKDKWAQGQLLIYQFAHSEDALYANIRKSFPAVAKRFNKADEDKIDASLFQGGENKRLTEQLRSKMDVQLRIPSDFFLALDNDDIFWIRKESSKASSSIILKKLKYTSQAQLTREGIKAVTDSIGRYYVSSQIPKTYQKINDVDLPMFVDITTVNGKYAVAARGIWEMENDFMGGPFVSYLVHNPEKNELIFLEGFVYAPGEDKRNFIQNLEYLISQVRF